MDKEYIFIQFVTVTPKDMQISGRISGTCHIRGNWFVFFQAAEEHLAFSIDPII